MHKQFCSWNYFQTVQTYTHLYEHLYHCPLLDSELEKPGCQKVGRNKGPDCTSFESSEANNCKGSARGLNIGSDREDGYREMDSAEIAIPWSKVVLKTSCRVVEADQGQHYIAPEDVMSRTSFGEDRSGQQAEARIKIEDTVQETDQDTLKAAGQKLTVYQHSVQMAQFDILNAGIQNLVQN